MKDIDKATARALSERILSLIKDTIKKEFGYDVNRTSGSYNDTTYNMKLEISKPLEALPKSTAKVTTEMLHYGMAPRGTAVTFGNKTYRVIKARKSKYLVQLEGATDNKQYVIPFEAVNLA